MRAPAPEAVKVTPELLMQLRRPHRSRPLGGRLAARVHRRAVVPREGRRRSRRGSGSTAPRPPRRAPPTRCRASRRTETLAYASDRGHAGRMSVWIDGRGELGEIPGSVEDIQWSPDGTLAARARRRPRLRPGRRADGDEDQGGGRGGAGSEGLPAGRALAAALPRRRRVGRDARGAAPTASTCSSSAGPAARSRPSAPTSRPRARGTTRGSG